MHAQGSHTPSTMSVQAWTASLHTNYLQVSCEVTGPWFTAEAQKLKLGPLDICLALGGCTKLTQVVQNGYQVRKYLQTAYYVFDDAYLNKCMQVSPMF